MEAFQYGKNNKVTKLRAEDANCELFEHFRVNLISLGVPVYNGGDTQTSQGSWDSPMKSCS